MVGREGGTAHFILSKGELGRRQGVNGKPYMTAVDDEDM